ncbi:MAG: hypothetical protein ACE5EX_09405 [Phycisphaerae bacterium]
MTIEIPISPETEAKLREKAAAVGEDISAYAAGVLERSARQPVSLEEISGPIAEEFRRSDMNEDDLTDLLEAAKHDMRRHRRTS